MGLPGAGPRSLEGAHRPSALTAAARIPGHALFFPAAASYAAAVLPASVASMLGPAPSVPGLAFPAGHAHELLFGFALAAVAGSQLGPTRRPMLAALALTWLLARASFLAAPMHLASASANAAFAALLALQLAPRLFGRAKKLRNRALPVALAALCACAIAMEVAWRVGPAPLQRGVLIEAVLLLSLLMLFMGGRIIAPAAAGQAYREGGDLAARVQPRLEGAIIAAMLLGAVAIPFGFLRAAGAAAAAAGLLALIRLGRWKLWGLRGRQDLQCLGLGYAWLGAGLSAVGGALMSGMGLVTTLHLITVGAMGTLTVNVMALTWLRLARRGPARVMIPVWSTALIAAAVLARVAADLVPDHRGALLEMAAAAWSAAYALLLWLFATVRRPRERRIA